MYAAYNGTIKQKGNSRTLGKYIIMKHDNGYETLYAHLSSFGNNLHENQNVLCGARIAFSGSSGRSTGPHMHFGLKKNGVYINPAIKISVPKTKLCGNNYSKFHRYTNAIDSAIKNSRK